MHQRRNIFIILLGLGFLFIITMLGTNLESILPQHPTASNQVVQAGPYQITLLEPIRKLGLGYGLKQLQGGFRTTEPTNLTIQIAKKNTQQLVTNATVVLENTMQTMDMGTGRSQAKLQDDGSYLAQLQFTMGGRWQVRVLVTVPSEQMFNATFEITVQ